MSFLFGNTKPTPRVPAAVAAPGVQDGATSDGNEFYRELVERRPALLDERLKLHARIVDEFNLVMLDKMPKDELMKHVRAYVADYVHAEKISLNQKELNIFTEEIINEMTGFGPIEPLLKDPTINDILINTHKQCFVERFGKLYETTVHFKDEAHLLRIINRIVAGIGRRVDESSPMCDARLPDGSRVNIAIRPIAVDGPLVSIRKFSEKPFSMDRLLEVGTLRPQMNDLLKAAAQGRVSMIISGGTGSGKTTLLNALSNYIPAGERLITIEDAAELQLQQPHVGRLETRPSNTEGKGEVRQRDLVKNALRMRPDRIIIGECRGDEAFDMLQAMNTGHEGSMTTIHANNPRDALKRLEQMVSMAGMPMTISSIRGQIASAITIVIQLQRLPDGKRRVTSISEITGMEGDVIQMHEIYRFVKESTDEKGMIHGSYRATGIRPHFLTDLKAYGIELPSSHFDGSKTALGGASSVGEYWVVYALIFGAALLAVQGGGLLLRSRKTEASVNRRLMLSAQGASPTDVLETLRRERGFADFDNSVLKHLSELWTQTGLRFDLNKLIFYYFAVTVIFFLISTIALGFNLLMLPLVLLAALGSVYLYLANVRRKRIARFSEQLPDAIEVICRGVKVGYPFSTALTLVAKEMPDPIGTEFGMTSDETTFGLEVPVALENLYRRVGQEDLLFLIIAISVQSQTGGKLADILSRLARLIRNRATLRLKVRSLSAEGRLSAIFLSIMPFVLVGIITVVSPTYFGSVVNHPVTMPLAILALTLLLVGNIVMYRMVNFKF